MSEGELLEAQPDLQQARERSPGLQLDELQALHEAKERTANAWPLWKGELLKCGWEEAAVRLDHVGATRVVVEA